MKNIIICDDTKPDEVLDLCEQHGLGIEVQAFYHPTTLSDPALVEMTANTIRGFPLISMHGPFCDLCPGSSDDEIREVSRKRFEQAWSISRQLDVSHIVFHHGYVPNTSWPAGWLKRWPEFWKDFLRNKDENIQVHIENHLDLDPTLISDAVAMVENDSFDINLDIGHAHFASKLPIVKWIEQLGSQIGYVHLHDNNGGKDEHLGLGQGTIPMHEVCHALEEYSPNSVWAIEAEGEGIVQSLEWLYESGFLKK